MKNNKKILSLAVLTVLILFTAVACKASVSGTYSCYIPNENGQLFNTMITITFVNGTFILSVPAESSPSGMAIKADGTYTISGKTLLVTGLDEPMVFTIKNSKTLTESDGSEWRKQ